MKYKKSKLHSSADKKAEPENQIEIFERKYSVVMPAEPPAQPKRGKWDGLIGAAIITPSGLWIVGALWLMGVKVWWALLLAGLVAMLSGLFAYCLTAAGAMVNEPKE